MCPLNCPYPRAQGTVSVLGPRQLSPGRAAQPPGGLHRQAPPVLRDRVLVSFPNPKSDHLLLLLKARQCSHCPRMTVTPPPGMPCPHSQPHPLRPCPHPPDTPACHVLSPRHSRALLPECLLLPAVSFLDLDTSHALLSPGTQSVLHLLGKAFPSRKSNSCRHCSSPSRTAGSEHLRMHLCADVSVSLLAGRQTSEQVHVKNKAQALSQTGFTPVPATHWVFHLLHTTPCCDCNAVSPIGHVLKPNAPCDGTWRWGLWGVLGS